MTSAIRVDFERTALAYRQDLQMAGVRCEFATNSERLTEALHPWNPTQAIHSAHSFRMEIVVDRELENAMGPSYFRGLHHVVAASFGPSNHFLFDLSRRRVSGAVCEQVAGDPRFWNHWFMPIAVGVMGSNIGLLPAHCACLTLDGQGLLIAGESGAGKSTLTMALAKSGFTYISDDWTYLAGHGSTLSAHGLGVPLKLLPDAVEHFPSLSEHGLGTALNGELAYEIDADKLGITSASNCPPRWFLFLERCHDRGSEFTKLPQEAAYEYLESSVERLPAQLEAAVAERAAILQNISRIPCWKLRYGGRPQFAAERVRDFVHQRMESLCLQG
jgi:hypothetical protein